MNQSDMQEQVSDLDERVTGLEQSVFGVRGEKGLAHVCKQLVEDMYHDQKGALVRLLKLEIERSKVEGMALLWKAFWHLLTFGAGIAIAFLVKK